MAAIVSAMLTLALAGAPVRAALSQAAEPTTMGERFHACYSAWVERRAASASADAHQAIRSNVFPGPRLWNNDEFQAIVALGPKALPYIVEKIPERHWTIAEAARRIAKWEYHLVEETVADAPRRKVMVVAEFPDIRSPSPPGAALVWLRWWRENPKWTEDRFAKLYGEWRPLLAQRKEKEAQEKYQAIKDLGIAALPYMMDKVRAGDTGLMAAISYLTDNAVAADAQPQACLEWWEKNKEQWTIPFPDVTGAAPVPEGALQPGIPEAVPAAGPLSPEARAAIETAREKGRKAAEEAREKAAGTQPSAEAQPQPAAPGEGGPAQ